MLDSVGCWSCISLLRWPVFVLNNVPDQHGRAADSWVADN